MTDRARMSGEDIAAWVQCSMAKLIEGAREQAGDVPASTEKKLSIRELKELCRSHSVDTSSALERTDLVALAQPFLPGGVHEQKAARTEPTNLITIDDDALDGILAVVTMTTLRSVGLTCARLACRATPLLATKEFFGGDYEEDDDDDDDDDEEDEEEEVGGIKTVMSKERVIWTMRMPAGLYWKSKMTMGNWDGYTVRLRSLGNGRAQIYCKIDMSSDGEQDREMQATVRFGLSTKSSSTAGDRALDPEGWGRKNDLLFKLHSESGDDDVTGEFSHLVPGRNLIDFADLKAKTGDLLWGSEDADSRQLCSSGAMLLRRTADSKLSWLSPGGTWLRGEYSDLQGYLGADNEHWIIKFRKHFDCEYDAYAAYAPVDTRRFWLREIGGVRGLEDLEQLGVLAQFCCLRTQNRRVLTQDGAIKAPEGAALHARFWWTP